MRHAIIDGDRVTGAMRGVGASGPEIPAMLDGVPLERLRWNGKAIVDVENISTWYVDAHGTKHLRAGGGRQKITCAWDAGPVRDGDGWRAPTAGDALAPRIKAECRRRILAVAKDATTQANLAGYVNELLARKVLDKGKFSADEAADIETARAMRSWIVEMQAACRDLIAAAEADFADGVHWPAAPEGAADLAERF